MMTFGSLFAGVGGFDLGFEKAGLECCWQVEIEPHATWVLAQHWPSVKRYQDVKDCGRHNLEPVDIISGGFPCQDVSIAGSRKGLAGEQSGLWYEFHRVLTEIRPEWVIIENVPGLLSSNRGWDFATILHGLGELRYLSAWRILDAQYFGMAQRRRRVFIVGHLGDGCAAEILFEREGSMGDSSPCRKEGEENTTDIAKCLGSHSGRYDLDSMGAYVPVSYTLSSFAEYKEGLGTLRAHGGDLGGGSETLMTYTIQSNDGGVHRRKDRPKGGLYVNETDKALTVGTTDLTCVVSSSVAGYRGVRRLTPTECERLQGFPDGWTEGQSDSMRYRQMGNAVCVPVAEWIGRRLLEQETHKEAVCSNT